MAHRHEVEIALAAWREAERQLAEADARGLRDGLDGQVARRKRDFQRISAEHMAERIEALQAAESRRASAQPSTGPFHAAAVEEKNIAAEIWEEARRSDEDTPRSN